MSVLPHVAHLPIMAGRLAGVIVGAALVMLSFSPQQQQ